ncbi:MULTISPECIES: hypothetical protein [Methylobacterium]|jgi:hypothetical protein|uniref:hypothetical protein n=1 Tax=Methylobacterium TaxID=407 RepID=UPI0005E9261C|nr:MULTISPECIES: hypothetical protein [Methylobacterium]MBN6821871.1 hypothetical protein [Methylobacterium organophilum]OXE38647.1 hypothetical protein CCS92_28310 [Methylobacterium radiotolerans]RUP24253.1 MAG: hypothetical protein EKK45_25750 [Curvibacter sp.]GAN50737.1 hypothetical protein ME121_4791 [Methylobacterium sp. ME121]
MSDDADPNREIVIERLMRRLEGFAVGIGLDEEMTRHIVERVITDMPLASDDDRLARARNWMLIASA